MGRGEVAFTADESVTEDTFAADKGKEASFTADEGVAEDTSTADEGEVEMVSAALEVVAEVASTAGSDLPRANQFSFALTMARPASATIRTSGTTARWSTASSTAACGSAPRRTAQGTLP